MNRLKAFLQQHICLVQLKTFHFRAFHPLSNLSIMDVKLGSANLVSDSMHQCTDVASRTGVRQRAEGSALLDK